ncbi:MAG TPA: cytochrome c biogenesis protein CcdA [Flavobacterium sp.]|nr:cytochrome c biogenesis protein CcdA [Flavobacterium sp.]
MKKLLFLFFAFLAFINVNSQILDPVKWTTKTEKISDTEFNLVFEGAIESEWHMYSQFTPDGGPLPLELVFKDAKGNFQLIGKANEIGTKREYNDVFEVDEIFWSNKAIIKQKVKIVNPSIAKITVSMDYQVCKQSCINQSKTLNFTIPPIKASAITAEPAIVNNEITNNVTAESDTAVVQSKVESNQSDVKAVAEVSKKQPKKDKEKGLFAIFFFAFLGGFAALLTPCVFPMIPMTVSFFTKQSKNRSQGIRNAYLYGFSIILIYVVLGLAITTIFGADALNALSTDPWFNIIFFLLLIVFAVSFLGAFEIMLPNSWANKVDRQADRGGIVGILFMALALAIVSFSCTGPIVGTLLVEAASKGGIAPIVGMLGFSTALALPFMFFAMFPGYLNSLPKSGGWLNTVKVVLGFLELALAFKFLSNADLVLQLHLLEREVFIAIWIAIFGALAFYLFGKLTLPHDSPLTHISVGRLSLGLIVLSFTIYMIPGLWGAPLKIINAFPPPMEYSESPLGFGSSSAGVEKTALPEGAKLGPHQIVVFDDYDDGVAYAKSVNKPIMLDFTGFACVNCRKMENNVWSAPDILNLLKNDIVVVSLYVDDKRELPKNEQRTTADGTEITTIGDKWTEFMITKYKTNTQPLYVMIDFEGNNLNSEIPTMSYDPDILNYKNWLKTGIKNFKK